MFKKFMIVAFILIIISIFCIDRKIKQSLVDSEKSVQQSESAMINQSKKSSAQTGTNPDEIVVKLTPEDPAKYGMVVNDIGSTPRTAEDWEKQLRENFEKQKTLDTEDAKRALEVAKTPEADYQKHMKDLDSHIDLFQRKLREDPLDKDADNQLQMLYQLKAVGKILREKVVTQDITPAQNAVPTVEPATIPPAPSQ